MEGPGVLQVEQLLPSLCCGGRLFFRGDTWSSFLRRRERKRKENREENVPVLVSVAGCNCAKRADICRRSQTSCGGAQTSVVCPEPSREEPLLFVVISASKVTGHVKFTGFSDSKESGTWVGEVSGWWATVGAEKCTLLPIENEQKQYYKR